MSICSLCDRKMNTWAESLRKERNGCSLLLEEINVTEKDINYRNIDCEEIDFGWITNGKMVYNKQIIVKNVRKCKYFKEK